MTASQAAAVPPRVRITEWRASAPLQLSDADLQALLAMPGRVEVRPCSAGRWQVVAQSFVGRVRLPTFDLEVHPKARVKNVLRLIAYARRIPELLEGVHEAADGCLADLVVAAFVAGVEDLVARGLRRDYRELDDDLPVLRGRLDIGRQLRQLQATRPTLSCRYEEHTLDTEFNAVLRFASLRAWSEWPELQRRITVLRSRLQEVPLRAVTRGDIDRFVYDRLTEYYAPAHRLCRLVLAGAGVVHELGTSAPAGSFLVDMNKVFEAFVGRWLRENVRPPFRVELQAQHSLDVEGAIDVQPDVLIRLGEDVVGVIDTKYKLRGNGPPASSDVYQALAYARRFGVRKAWLVFADDHLEPRTTTAKDHANVVMSVGLGLGRDWPEIIRSLEQLRDEVCVPHPIARSA